MIKVWSGNIHLYLNILSREGVGYLRVAKFAISYRFLFIISAYPFAFLLSWVELGLSLGVNREGFYSFLLPLFIDDTFDIKMESYGDLKLEITF